MAFCEDTQESPVMGGGGISRYRQQSDIAEAQCPRGRRGYELGRGQDWTRRAPNASDTAFIKDAESSHFARSIGSLLRP